MANKGHVLAHTTLTKPVVTGWQTFTPTVTLVGGAGNTVPVYTTNIGRYMQVGTLTYVQVTLSGDGGDEGAGTGAVNIDTPITASADWNATTISKGKYVNGGAPADLTVGVDVSGTTMKLFKSAGPLTGADQNNASRSITFTCWYESV